MDGSGLSGLAQEVTITNTGLFILVGIVVVVLSYVIIKHLRDCSGHRSTFHDADRAMQTDIAELKTDVKWIKHALGYKGGDDD